MKKILIISHNAMSLHANNGKTLASIFGGWPAEKLAQLYFNVEIPDFSNFNNYFRLSEIDVLKGFLGGGGVISPHLIAASGTNGFINKLVSRIFNFLKTNKNIKLILRDVFYALGFWKSKKLDRWIVEFSPDCIFFLGGDSVFSFFVTFYISRRYNIPFYIYFTDDYVLSKRLSGMGRLLQRRRINVFRLAFSDAKRVFVIGSEMASAYKAEFGVDCYPVMNCVESVPDFTMLNFSRYEKKCVDVVYIGGLHLGRSDSIISFASILRDVFCPVGLKFLLSVYSVQEPDDVTLRRFESSGVSYCGALRQSQVTGRLRDAHYVLHVESFDVDFVEATKYSVSTKISEYLSSGAIVIGFGPSVVASIKLLRDNALGIVFTEECSPEDVANNLVESYFSQEVRSRYINSSLSFAREYFLADKVRSDLYSLIND